MQWQSEHRVRPLIPCILSALVNRGSETVIERLAQRRPEALLASRAIVSQWLEKPKSNKAHVLLKNSASTNILKTGIYEFGLTK